MPRIKLDDSEVPSETKGYFTSTKSNLEFIDSGAAPLNCVLGGGWPLGRISNVVGDKSTGKTLLAIEACSSFARQYPKGNIWYRESESAFDKNYAHAIGMPIDRVRFTEDDGVELFTIEDFFEDLNKRIESSKGEPGFYALDSLDGLSDDEELKADFDKGTYGMRKPKLLHKLMRILSNKLEKTNIHLMIISQEKDNINAGLFGKKSTRSGGRALDFFCSQILWLAKVKTLKREIDKVERPTGIIVKAKCEKNKINLPYRECGFTIRFAHGIDRLESNLSWLKEVDYSNAVLPEEYNTSLKYNRMVQSLEDADYWKEVDRVDAEVVRIWNEIEAKFLESNREKRR